MPAAIWAAGQETQRAGVPRPGPASCDPGDAPITRTISAPTLGEAWLATAELILREGRPARWGTEPTREVALLSIAVGDPDPDDALIGRLGDPAWLAWMRANFREPGAVAELGDADSYARRLRDYAGTGRDQVAWLAARLAADPSARDATSPRSSRRPTRRTSHVSASSTRGRRTAELSSSCTPTAWTSARRHTRTSSSLPPSSVRSPLAPGFRPADSWST